MNVEVKSTRFHRRTKLETSLEVFYKEDAGFLWDEHTQTEDVTICGAGFVVSHPVEPDRLISLKISMPKNFRLFDFGKKDYEVWGLVRYVRLIETDLRSKISLKVGAALIGNNPPAGFLGEAADLYELKPVLRDQSFWDVRELPRRTGPYVRSQEERPQITIQVSLEIIDTNGQIYAQVIADTLNVSHSGMALTVQLSEENLRYVLIKTLDGNISLLAKTRGVFKLDDNNMFRIHLQFISGKWSV